jgi:hypothetical protein
MENEELVINDQELNTSEIQDNDSFLIEDENVLETESESIQENKSEPTEELDGEIALEIAGEEIKPDDDELIDGQPAPNWVKDLRRDFKQTQKENKELKRRLEEQSKAIPTDTPDNVSVPPKPTLEACDFDDARFETELANWYEKKSHAEKAEKQKIQQQQEYQQRFNQRLEAHKIRAAKLPVKDYQEAEEVVRSELPDIHKELIIHCADEGSELIAYGLGKSKAIRQRVIAEKDPLRAAYLLGQISQQVKLAPKPKKVINREPEIKGGGANASSDEFNKLCPGAKIE